MPFQSLPARLALCIPRHPDPLPVEGHVGLAVAEVVLEAAADEEAAVGGDGDVAGVEKTVDIGAEEEAVVEAVLASFGHRPDVGGVQDGEGLLSRHGAAALVVVRDQDPEGALAQTRTHQDRISPHRRLLQGGLRHLSGPGEQTGAYLVPEVYRRCRIGLIGLTLDDVLGEVRRGGDPEELFEEEGVPQDDAADEVVRADRVPSVLLDSPLHLRLSRRAVLRTEGVPGEGPGEGEETDEKAAAHDEVVRAVGLEEERLPGMERPEGPLAAGLPEVHLINIGQVPEVAEPVVVGDGDSQAHPARLVSGPILADSRARLRLSGED